ncbi:hypothetical protein HPT27_00480 [Permianibacter sp. IMCC34836]|uniref:hypothetical protein n=1 Tax=Permianibacter fluminis TaxID=2738515 RepID=UPI0015565B74|nr:hypothetical protein [Permianibacter fluminis]NQD35477.1 hypothetical protein [Permianibacter fluminis]
MKFHTLVFLLLIVSPTAGAGKPNFVLPLSGSIGGGDAEYHVARWWRWVNKVPDGVRPYQDPTGQLCGLNQTGDVWFLAGTDGTSSVRRSCTVPSGKYLFLPIIAVMANTSPTNRRSCDELKKWVSINNDNNVTMKVVLDGIPIGKLDAMRVRTEKCFNAFADALYVDKPELYSPAASDGYWLFLRPLPEGEHTLVVEANYNSPDNELGDLRQQFQYRLRVEPERKSDDKKSKVNEILTVFHEATVKFDVRAE